ncbi:MAG: GNAT family N-acetyltransferase [Candidatus Thorarchaeota archaeon]
MYFGEKVKLRALEMSDLDDIMKHWNNYELRRFLAHVMPMSENAERVWLESATKENPWKDGRLTLAIEEKRTGEFLGTISLFDISKQMQRAEFGISIHNPENFGKGYGTDATKVMLWIGFQVLGLNSIYLYTIAYNDRAQKAYEKAGFKRIGVYRQAIFIEGRFHDFIAMDILKDDFFEMYPPGKLVGEA